MNKLLPSLKRNTMKVTSAPVTLRNIELRDYNFEVPLYQREYSWELDQVSDLFSDIENSNEDYRHFLGSILLFAKDESTREIIGGQQRLTTIFLILHSIRRVLKKLDPLPDVRITKGIRAIDEIIYQRSERVSVIDESDEPRLTISKRDKKLFNAILKGEAAEQHNRKIKSHKLLLYLVKFLETKIEKINTAAGIDGIVSFLDKVIGCEYIVMTAELKQDQFLLFKSLNSRGLELSIADLIKNEVCSSHKLGNKVDEAVEMWDDMREILERAAADVDAFLFYFINSLSDSHAIRKKMREDWGGKDIKDFYPPVPEKLLFEVYEEKLKGYSNPALLLQSLKDVAIKYVEICNPSSDNVHLMGLKTMNITKCYPLLLRGKEVLSDKSFNKLTKAVFSTLAFYAFLAQIPQVS